MTCQDRPFHCIATATNWVVAAVADAGPAAGADPMAQMSSRDTALTAAGMPGIGTLRQAWPSNRAAQARVPPENAQASSGPNTAGNTWPQPSARKTVQRLPSQCSASAPRSNSASTHASVAELAPTKAFCAVSAGRGMAGSGRQLAPSQCSTTSLAEPGRQAKQACAITQASRGPVAQMSCISVLAPGEPTRRTIFHGDAADGAGPT